MVSLEKITALINNLKARAEQYSDSDEYSTGYRDALNDCLYDLQREFDSAIEQELLECMPPQEIAELFYDQFIIGN